MQKFTLHAGDCLEVMAGMEENSVDAVVCDPPYHLTSVVKRFGKEGSAPAKDYTGIKENATGAYARASRGFMGKQWDGGDIAFRPETWEQVFRVLKPGGHLLAFSGTRTYHRMACAIEDAGFEIRDQIAWVYGCYSEDTECLTREGWKQHTSLTLSDEILQWDSETNALSWAHPKQIFVYDAPSEMVHILNRHTDQLLTANHRVYAKIRRHSRNAPPEAYEIVEAGSLKKHWQKSFPLAGRLDGGSPTESGLMYLVGWWLTDAWAHGDGKACMFSQCKPKTLAKLRAALVAAGATMREYERPAKKEAHSPEHVFYVTGALADYLLREFPHRQMGWELLSLDYAGRFSIVEGLLDGDGSREGRGHSEAFWSRDPVRLDIFQALCVSLNIRSHIDYAKGVVYLNRKTNTTQLQNKHTTGLEPYAGRKVWCLETGTGAFVVRRNGRAFISGNSGFPKSLDISKAIDKSLGATGEYGAPKSAAHAGWIARGRMRGGEGHEGYQRPWMADEQAVDKNARKYIGGTDKARAFQGFGTALKPAMEPICLARKPLSEKTVAENVLRWGTGALNIDATRIGPGNGNPKPDYRPNNKNAVYGSGMGGGAWENTNGRWPANLCHDGSDEVLALFPESKGQQGDVRGDEPSGVTKDIYGKFAGRVAAPARNDTGSAARFFKECQLEDDEWLSRLSPALVVDSNLSLSKVADAIAQSDAVISALPAGTALSATTTPSMTATAKELRTLAESVITAIQNIGPKCLREWQQLKLSPSSSRVSVVATREPTGIMTITASHWRLDGSADPVIFAIMPTNLVRGGADSAVSRFNYHAKASAKDRVGSSHPTIKPVALMRWLVRLVTPPNGVVLDPFAGTGTTGQAALEEGFRAVLIEREEEYRADIARRMAPLIFDEDF